MMSGLLTAATVCLLSGMTMTAFAQQERFSSTIARDIDGDICVDFTEVQVILPGSWAGICQMGKSADSVSFYQTKSRELYTKDLGFANGGLLFSIGFSETLDFMDLPSYTYIGQVSDGYYYASFPTDVQGYVENQEAITEYSSMCEDLEFVTDNISITANEVYSDIDLLADYIFPQSSIAYLTKEDLAGMTAQEVQTAINEIYARHHRKFVREDVQAYFNTKSWYEGYVEADEFDISVMNNYEGYNINLMVEYLKTAPTEKQNVAIVTDGTKDAYGMIIESGNGYFRIRTENGSIIQFWFDYNKLEDMGIVSSDLAVGATVSLIYDAEDYEAVSILVF